MAWAEGRKSRNKKVVVDNLAFYKRNNDQIWHLGGAFEHNFGQRGGGGEFEKKSILIKALFHEHNYPMFLLFRNINGFLNTGKGGTIYLGIVDEGKVKGLLLTQYQVRKIEFEFAMSVMIKVEQGLCNWPLTFDNINCFVFREIMSELQLRMPWVDTLLLFLKNAIK